MTSRQHLLAFEVDRDLAATLGTAPLRSDREVLWLGSTSGDTDRYAARIEAGERGRPELQVSGALRRRPDIDGPWRPFRPTSRQRRLRATVGRLYRRGHAIHGRQQYRVYVGGLDAEKAGRRRLYVGQTSKHPEQRWAEHVTGATTEDGVSLASRAVHRYGGQLRHDLMRGLPVLASQADAEEAERQVAHALSLAGWWVDGDGTSTAPAHARHVRHLDRDLDELLAEHGRLTENRR